MSLKKNVIANYLGQGWRALMAVAFVPLYIKYLGIEAYGLIGIFAVLQAWLSLLDMGMKPVLGREMARFTAGARDVQSIRDLLRSIEFIGLVVAVVVALGIGSASSWLASEWLTAESLPIDMVARAFVIMGMITGIRFLENIYLSSIVGLQRQVLENVVTGTMATVRSVGAVAVLKWVSPTIEVFFIWQGLISLLTVGLYAGVVYRVLPPSTRPAQFSGLALLDIRHFAAGMMATTFLALLLTQMDKVLLSRLLTLKAFSYYVFASVVAGMLHRLTGPITAAFYPRLTEYATRNDQNALRRTYHQAAQLVAVFVGAAAVFLMMFGDRILLLWTADASLTDEVARLLPVLTLGTLLNALMWTPYQLQLAHGWTALAVKVNVIAVIVLIPAILWIVPAQGAIGAAWVWVALNAGYLVVTVLFMHRRLLPTEKWRWYGCDVAAPLLAATLMAALCRWVVPDETGKIVEFVVLLMSSGCVLLAAAMAAPMIGHQLMKSAAGAFRLIHARLRTRNLGK